MLKVTTRYDAEAYEFPDRDGKTEDTIYDLLRTVASDIDRFEGSIQLETIEAHYEGLRPYLLVTVSAHSAADLAEWA